MVKPETLYNTLTKDYDVISFRDLASVTAKHGSIFKLLKSMYRDNYSDNQRIVFYTSHRISKKILDHLQRAIQSNGIDNYFILICSPHDITDDLQKIADKYYIQNTLSIGWQKVNLLPTDVLAEDKIVSIDSFCPAPFNSVLISNDLYATPCCRVDHTVFLEDASCNLQTTSIQDIMNSKSYVDLRKAFINNQKPEVCQNCWQEEQTETYSARNSYVTRFLDRDGDLDEVDNIALRYLGVTPSTICNFKCRICNPQLSSSIAAEEIQYTHDPEKKKVLSQLIKAGSQIDMDWYRKLLDESIDSIESIHIFGGEPTLIKNLSDLLQYIIDSGCSKDIELLMNTNLSTWNEKLATLMTYFKEVRIHCSIDAIGEKFEVQRHGGKWNQTTDNLQKWLSKTKQINWIVKLDLAVNIQNVLYLDEVVNLADDNNIEIVWGYVTDPQSMCIDNITQAAKDLIYHKFKHSPCHELQTIANRVAQNPAVSGEDFINLMDLYDLRRGTNFKQSHGEIYDAMSAK